MIPVILSLSKWSADVSNVPAVSFSAYHLLPCVRYYLPAYATHRLPTRHGLLNAFIHMKFD